MHSPTPQISTSLLRRLKNGLIGEQRKFDHYHCDENLTISDNVGLIESPEVSVLNLWEGRMGALTRERRTGEVCLVSVFLRLQVISEQKELNFCLNKIFYRILIGKKSNVKNLI